MGKPAHDYHLVNPSKMPLLASLAALLLAIGALFTMHEVHHGGYMLGAGFIAVIACMFFWWRDVLSEAINDKAHTPVVQNGLRLGMTLFILSEVMFFFAFFWSFFKAYLFPVDGLDEEGIWPVVAGIWPPEGITPIGAWGLPFTNTVILLLSGTTVTWAHHAALHNDRKGLQNGLLLTVILGIIFSAFQAYEYIYSPFGFKEGVFASNFYLATGFHGFHVIIGTLFLAVCYFRSLKSNHLTPKGLLGLDFAAWYWHFVDVVWLFLFVAVYIFGSAGGH